MDEQTKLTSADNNVAEQPETAQNTEVTKVLGLDTQATSEEVTVKAGEAESIQKEVSPQEVEATKSSKEAPDPSTQMLDEEEEMEYSKEEFAQMSQMYEETMSDFVEGEVVIGKVLAVNDKEASVDIGFKSEGTISLEEFPDPSEIVVGDTIEVFLDEIEDKEGQLVLSKKKADFMRIWSNINDSYNNGEIIRGKCIRRIKGGIVVDLNGVDAFLPGSQIDVRPIRDFDAIIGKELEFKVVKINNLRKNIVVSHRVLVEEEVAEVRRQILSDLERGQVLEGSVKNITDFGVFIDLGGVDGLLHINDLSWGRVSHPSEVVALDEKIKVVVLDFNDDKNRISLGLKQLQPHPWEEVDKKYPVDSVVRGKVVSITDYGAFVELEKGVEGLIHISEMSWTQHIKHPSKILSVGEMVEAKVLNIEKDERKISLGLKQLEPDPWESLAERYLVGSRHRGKVRNLTNFGAFVELEEGIDGLVHISDLSWTKKIRHPGEVIKKGEELEVAILGVDRENRRISLGYKQTMENPWEVFEENYKPGTLTKGKIVRLIEKGVVVELPLQVEGFVPMSHLDKRGMNKPADEYKLDDEIDLCVIEFSKDNKKIVLSEKRAHEKMAVTDMETGAAAKVEGAEDKKDEDKEEGVAEGVEVTAQETEAKEAETGKVTEPVQEPEEKEDETVEKVEANERAQVEEAKSEETEETVQKPEAKEDETIEKLEATEQDQVEETKSEETEETVQKPEAKEDKTIEKVEATEQDQVEETKSEEIEKPPQDAEAKEGAVDEKEEPAAQEAEVAKHTEEVKGEEEEPSSTLSETVVADEEEKTEPKTESDVAFEEQKEEAQEAAESTDDLNSETSSETKEEKKKAKSPKE